MAVRPHKNKKGETITGKWAVDYYPAGGLGKRIIEVFVGTREEAIDYEIEKRRQHAPPATLLSSPKIVDVLPDYKEWLKLHRSPTTYRDMLSAWIRLLPYFGYLKFPQITRAEINKYKQVRIAQVGSGRVNKELTYLSSLISYAVRNDMAYPLPFKIEKLPYNRPIPKIPHPEDIERFIRAATEEQEVPAKIRGKVTTMKYRPRDPERKKALILFLYEAGLRWTEATHLRWENIDWSTGVIYLKKTKGNKEGMAFLSPRIRETLEPMKREEGWIFANQVTGRPWGSFKTLFRGAAKRAGIRHLHPHLLRHAFATYALEASGNLRAVQALLRHSKISTTEIYTQVAVEHLRTTQEKTIAYLRGRSLERKETEAMYGKGSK